MKPHIFNGTDPITILNFLQVFKTACNTNGLHEGAATCMFQFYLKEPVRALLSARIRTTSRDKSSRQGKLSTYFQLVPYLFKAYATDDVIAEAEAELRKIVQAEK